MAGKGKLTPKRERNKVWRKKGWRGVAGKQVAGSHLLHAGTDLLLGLITAVCVFLYGKGGRLTDETMK